MRLERCTFSNSANSAACTSLKSSRKIAGIERRLAALHARRRRSPATVGNTVSSLCRWFNHWHHQASLWASCEQESAAVHRARARWRSVRPSRLRRTASAADTDWGRSDRRGSLRSASGRERLWASQLGLAALRHCAWSGFTPLRVEGPIAFGLLPFTPEGEGFLSCTMFPWFKEGDLRPKPRSLSLHRKASFGSAQSALRA